MTLLTVVMVHAASTLSFGELKIKPGETKSIEMNLTNTASVKGMEFAVTLPTGLSFVWDEEEEEYVVGSRCSFLSSTLRSNGTLKVAGAATKAKDYVKAGEGAICSFLVKAADNVTLGNASISISEIEIVTTDGTENPNVLQFTIKVYQEYEVTAVPSSETMGSVTGGGTYEAGTEATITATPNEGYQFSKWSDDTTVNPYVFTVNNAVSLTATFVPIVYNLTYDLAGGALPEGKTNPADFTIETEDITLVNPERVGYTFTGWTGTGLEAATMEVKIAKGSTGDRSYTATWTPITYTIAYDLAGGALPEGKTNPESYNIESDAITLNNPERVGYTFTGWTGTGLEAATMEVTIAKGSIENRTYTATWTPITYTLSYDLAGGALPEGKTNPETYNIESDAITLNNPERVGYTFAGWTGTGLEAATMEVTIAKGCIENRTYTATWTPITYTLTYDLAGGALPEGKTNPETYNIESDAITLNNPERVGYTFTGWTGTGLEAATMEVTIAKGSIENRTYTATWTPITYQLTYDLAGGVLAQGETNPATYNVESDAITLKNPTRDGYDFAGWTGTGLDAATIEVTIAKGSIGDRSYTATWTPTAYTLTYDLAGGALPEGKINPVTYNIESDAITLNNPERVGYTFAGWTGTGLETATMEVTIAKGSTGDRSFTATWTPITYTITYDLAGGALPEGKTNPESFTIESEDIILNNPVRTGYDFAGWTGTGLTEATMEVKIAKGSVENRSYTATWTPTTYTLTYDLAGGALPEGKTNPETYNIESEAITLNNPVRDGYTFAGWTGTGLTEATMEVTIAKGSTGARSYTATWTPITYTLTYDLASGALPEGKTNPATYTIESEDITLVNPERVGYTFAGWTGTGLEAATVEVKIAKGSTGDRSYTATWTPTVYTLTYDLAGGVLAEGEVNPATYTIESETITLKNPVREGYEFAGWIGTGLETATVNVTIAKGSTGDRSYTATWTPITYTITYDLAGGALAQGDTNPATYTIESDAITLKNPTREGYDFTGWTGTGLTEATMTVTIAKGCIGNRTYTATWKETVGVKAIFRDSKTLNVYTVSGSLVGRDMTVDEVLQLKSGIYVINGRKVAIK